MDKAAVLHIHNWILCLVTQSCLALWDLMDCGPSGSSVHRIFQARMLEWVAIFFSRGSFLLRNWTGISCIAGGFLTSWATREVTTTEYYWAIKRNGAESVLMRWMALEPIIQSEVSQKEKQIPSINACIWNLERWSWWAYSQGRNRDADIEKTCGHGEAGKEGGAEAESSVDTHALPCVKETAGGNFPYDSGNSNRGSATTQRAGVGWKVGGMSKTEGTHVSLWLMHVDVRQKPTQYCKTIIL